MSDPRTLFAVILTFAASGWLLSLVLLPERLGAVRRSSLSLALAVPAAVLLATPLVLFDRLAADLLALGYAILAAVAIAVALARSVGRTRRLPPGAPVGIRGLARVAGARLRRGPRVVAARAILVGLGIGTVYLAIVGPQIAAFGSDGLPQGSIPWYYWRLVQETLLHHGLPDTITEWGSPRPFPLWWLATTVHGAATAALAGDSGVGVMETYRLAVMASGLLAAWALFRRWLPAWWALLAAAVLLAASRVAVKLGGYRPETLGLILVLWSAWAFDIALERRSARWGIVAGAISGTAWLAHAEVWLLTGPLFLGILLGRLAFPTGRPGHAGRWQRATLLAAALRQVVVPAAVVAAVIVGAAGLAFGGGVETGGARTSDATAAWPDPTWAFYVAISGDDPLAVPRPVSWSDPAVSSPFNLHPFPRVNLASKKTLLVVLLAGVLLLAELRRMPAAARRGAVAFAVTVAGMVIGSWLLWMLYPTYVPARAGPLRIEPLYVVGFAGFVGLAAWGLAARISGGVDTPRRWRKVGVAGLIGGTLFVALPFLVAFTPIVESRIVNVDRGLSTAGYEAYVWMRANLPPDAVILANGYTDGALGAVSQRNGWLDGRAPYLEEPEWLGAAIRHLIDAREYFAAPDSRADLLPAEVGYVLVAARREDIGTATAFPAPLDAFDRSPNLSLVGRFGDGSIRLYRVIEAAPSSPSP